MNSHLLSSVSRRGILPALVLGFSLIAACAATSDKSQTATGSNSRSARLTEDVTWLAADARQGRRAGTEGERAAAEFIAERLASLGIEAAGEAGFLQSVEVPLEPEDRGGTWVKLTAGPGGAPQAGTTIKTAAPLFCSAGGGAASTLVFAGYGIRNEEREWDDYGKTSLNGAVVMIVRGAPEIPVVEDESAAHNPHGGGNTSPFGSSAAIFNKVMAAKHLGAAAVILAQHPRDRGTELLAFHNGHTAATKIPAIMVSVEDASALIPDFEERVAAIDARAKETGKQVTNSSEALGQVALSSDVRRGNGTATNVLGLLPGKDHSRVIVLGAHFDHLGMGGTGSLSRDTWGDIHNGADDNASGTAVVLELARSLSQGEQPECDVLFALWSGEELGLLGSAHWVQNPTVALDRVVCNLNFDMVGRAGDGVLQVLGAGTSPEFGKWMTAAGAASGLKLSVNMSGDGIGGSDHQSFIRAEIPALHFFSGVHTDYHKPTDDAERFEAEGAERTTQLALDLVSRIGAQSSLPFVEVAREASGARRKREASWSVTFGSVPNYAWEGEGLLIDGTSAGSPAERAGLLGGDILVGLNDLKIGDIHDFVYTLQVHKPGDVVEVHFKRGGKLEHVMMTLGSRELE
ncbi:MAG: hypothetical protein ACI8TQ_002057 [Planctomycetota bacterium]|jgi:hypothetical protein